MTLPEFLALQQSQTASVALQMAARELLPLLAARSHGVAAAGTPCVGGHVDASGTYTPYWVAGQPTGTAPVEPF